MLRIGPLRDLVGCQYHFRISDRILEFLFSSVTKEIIESLDNLEDMIDSSLYTDAISTTQYTGMSRFFIIQKKVHFILPHCQVISLV